MASDEQKNIEDMFGSDSDPEEETFKGTAARSTVNESTSGLFGSDSESEEEKKPKKLKKTIGKKSSSKPPKPAKRKPSRPSADDDNDGENHGKSSSRQVEGDEYDSGEEVSRSKDDDAFIDDEDDLDGLLDEYNEDKQNFNDERPDEDEERFDRGRNEDYFEETLKSMKTGRGRGKLKMSPQEIETLAQELVYNMDQAYNQDQKCIDERRPALQKIKLVDKVGLLLRKVQLQLPILDYDFLGVVKKWIQPLENGSLPNIGLRTKMLEMCQRLPIDKEHLKRSGFGKIVMTLWKHPDETLENKEICRQLIDRWSRSVFSKTMDFTKLAELEAEKREANGSMRPNVDRRPTVHRGMERNRGFLSKDNTTSESSNSSSRVRMPEQIRIDFTMRPQPKVDASQIPSTKIDPESKKARLMKRMQMIARPSKRAKRANALNGLVPLLKKSAKDTTMAESKSKEDTLAEFKLAFREYLTKSHVANDDEMTGLMECLNQPLPVCFRLNLDGLESERLKSLISTKFQFPCNTYYHNDIAITPPESIAWYPQQNTAWQVACGRVAFSKAGHQPGPVQDFHKCLLEHTEYGNIDRQEAASMLPVLLLQVKSGQKVLDMCASPGSKTTQILDLIQEGMVVANDMNKKRAYMLVHRLSRNTLQSAVVTCGPGQLFPGLFVDGTLKTTNVFDRVLCDVPCSGDGTLRKSQALWKEWHIGQGLTLFPTQLALALRGAALLHVGGVMVYSTCSFNPIEDEAVVAELLRRSDGALEVLDASNSLPGLKYRPGRVKWSVGWRSKSKSCGKGHIIKKVESTNEMHHWFDDYNDVPTQLQGDRIMRCMFPPTDAATQAALKRCMRLVPTDQDSGGFFIAVLRKTKELPGIDQVGLPPLDEIQIGDPPVGYVCKLCNKSGHYMKHCELFDTVYETEETPATKKSKIEPTPSPAVIKEEPYRRITDEVWSKLQCFYGITDESLRAKLWSRSDTSAQINFVQEGIVNSCMAGNALTIVNTGLKVFTKTSDGFFRPTSEGLATLRPYLSKRLLSFTLSDFKLLVASPEAVAYTSFKDLENHDSTKDLSSLPLGPAVGVLLPPSKSIDPTTFQLLQDRLLCNLWLGKGSFLPRLSATKRAEMTELLRAYLD